MQSHPFTNIHQECIETLKLVRKYATDYRMRNTLDVFGDKLLIIIFGAGLIMSSMAPFLIDNLIPIVFLPLTLVPFGILFFAIVYRIFFYNIFHFINLKKRYSYLIDNIESNHLELYDDIHKTKNIEEILHRTRDIYKYIRKLRLYRYIWRYSISPTGVHYLNTYISLEIHFILEVLNYFHSNIELRIIEQKKVLEQAKSSLSNHIRGTDELNQVSELQKQRLDKQIEQFEELQRVLVKV